VNVDAQALSDDEFVLFAPGVPLGDPLTITASFSVTATTLAVAGRDEEGGGDANATAISEAHIGLSSGSNQLSIDAVARCDHDSVDLECTNSGFGEAPAVLVVANGAPVLISILGRARASGAAGQSGAGTAYMNGSADLGSTIAWNGIESLTDSGGSPVGEFTALSANTGFDYRFEYAPEPDALGLAAAAGAALGLVARRRSA
jgi:hypothetical protein